MKHIQLNGLFLCCFLLASQLPANAGGGPTTPVNQVSEPANTNMSVSTPVQPTQLNTTYTPPVSTNTSNYVAPTLSNYTGASNTYNGSFVNNVNSGLNNRPYIGDLNSVRCGFNVFAGASNGSNSNGLVGVDGKVSSRNTEIVGGVSWTNQKCVDPQKIEKIRDKGDTQRVLMQTNTAQNIECMRLRLEAIKNSLNADDVCVLRNHAE